MAAVTREFVSESTQYPLQVQAVPFDKVPKDGEGAFGRPIPYAGRQLRDHKLITVEWDNNQIFVSSTGKLEQVSKGFNALSLIPLMTSTLTLVISVALGDIPLTITATLGVVDSIAGLAIGTTLTGPLKTESADLTSNISKIVTERQKDTEVLLKDLKEFTKEHGTKWQFNLIGQLTAARTKL